MCTTRITFEENAEQSRIRKIWRFAVKRYADVFPEYGPITPNMAHRLQYWHSVIEKCREASARLAAFEPEWK